MLEWNQFLNALDTAELATNQPTKWIQLILFTLRLNNFIQEQQNRKE